MMYMCSTKFELTYLYLEGIKQDRTRNEQDAEDEELNTDREEDYVDGISDTEEEESVSNLSDTRLTVKVPSQQVPSLSARARREDETGDRSSDDDDDDDGVLPLPEGTGEKRISGRTIRPSKRLRE
jgi:hypothetical protein